MLILTRSKTPLSAYLPAGGIDTGLFDFNRDPGEEPIEIEASDIRIPLRTFTRQAWNVIEPGTPFLYNWHIDVIADHLEALYVGEIHKLLINVPIRCMKSIAVTVMFPAWTWTFDPAFQFLTASYVQNLATRDALKSRRIIQSNWYQAKWGNVFSLTTDQNTKTRYENDQTGYRIATSVAAQGQGEGGDCRIIDDPHDARKVHSEARRETDLGWHKEVWSGRVNDPKRPLEVVVMQRLHHGDLSGHLLAEQGDYTHLCLPMRYEPKRRCVTQVGDRKWEDPRSKEGELLWDNRFGEDEVADLEKRLGTYGASGQLQQNPTPADGGMVKRTWWRRYRKADLPEDGFDEVIQSWDMSFKKTTDGSYVVGQVWGRKGANKYILDQMRERMSFPESLRAVRTMSAKWPIATLKLVENKANGPAIIDTLRTEISGLVAVNADISKEARVAAVSPQIEAGNVWAPEDDEAPWAAGFIEEFAAFPKGAADDQVDSGTQALNRLEHGTAKVIAVGGF